MRYIVTQELKSRTQINKWLYLSDMLFAVAYCACASFMFGSLVHQSLHIPYYIFNGALGLGLTFHSPFNKGKRMFQSLYYLLLGDRFLYKPVSNKRSQPLSGLAVRRREKEEAA